MQARAAVVWLAVATGCTPPEEAQLETGGPGLDAALARRLGDGEAVTVIVGLDPSTLPPLPAGDVPRRAARARLRDRADALADLVRAGHYPAKLF